MVIVRINFNMGCIETSFFKSFVYDIFWINFNMGCIETKNPVVLSVRPKGLTLTWDVLKRIKIRVLMHSLLFKFNMGCIETFY